MKFCVIGLGRFGYQVATVLAENGMEVMAVDRNESIVASIRDQVTQAVSMNVTDEALLRSIGADEMDTVIVAMGNFAQSILITALLKKKLGIPKVIARGISEIHKEILKHVGADRIILPEKDIGTKLADNLSLPFMDLIRVSKDFSISLVIASKKFVGKKLIELQLFDKYQVKCIGIQKDEKITPLEPGYTIAENDKLIFAGINKNLEQIAKL